MTMPISSACGFGDMDDPKHLQACLLCNRAAWAEYRRANPSRLRRWLDRKFPAKPLSLPPGAEGER